MNKLFIVLTFICLDSIQYVVCLSFSLKWLKGDLFINNIHHVAVQLVWNIYKAKCAELNLFSFLSSCSEVI